MTDEEITTQDSTGQTSDLTGVSRRSFLKKGAIAGVGVAALYVAPQMSSVTARPAYASVTGAITGGTWRTLANIPNLSSERFGGEGMAASVIGGKIYVSHGYRDGDTNELIIYDIGTNSWSAGLASPGANTSELIGAAAGGRHYAIGGRDARADVYSYLPGSNTWRIERFLGTPRRGLGAAVIGSKIYAVGGSTGTAPHTGTPLATNEVLDTSVAYVFGATPAWITKAPMPLAVMGVYATTAHGGKMYVFGGFNSGVRNNVQIYDPGSDSWSAGTPMPTARSNAVAGVCCGTHIHVIGGLNPGTSSASNKTTHEVYTPSTDSWLTDTSLPVGRSEMAAGMTTHNEKIHVIGSGPRGLSSNTHFVYPCPLV